MIRNGKKNQIHAGKGEVKVFLSTNYMFPYLGDPKSSTKTLLESIPKFSNTAGYKISMQKSVGFLYINNKLTEKEIKKIKLSTIARIITQWELT